MSSALGALARQADQLMAIELKAGMTGMVDRAPAWQAVQRAQAAAERTVDELAVAGIGDAPMRDARTAVRILEHAPLDDVALHSTGRTLRSITERIAAHEEVATLVGASDAASILELPAVALTRTDWARLRDIADLLPEAAIAGVPPTLDGAPAFRLLLGDLAAGAGDVASAQRYFDAWAIRRLDPQAQAAELANLVGRAARQHDESSWGRLANLLEHGDPAAASAITVADELREAARQASRGDVRAAHEAQELFDAHAIASLSTGERAKAAQALLRGTAAGMAPEQWSRLAVLLSDEGTRSAPTIAKGLVEAPALATLAREISRGSTPPGAAQRHLDAFQLASMGIQERAAAAGTLLSRDAESLSHAEWSRLAALLDDAKVRGTVDLPKELPATKPLAQIAREVGEGQYRPTPKTQAYFDLYRLNRMGDDERLAAASALMERDAAVLSNAEWRTLSQLLDHDRTWPLLNLPGSLPGVKDLRQVAREVAAGQYAPSLKTQQYFELFRLRRLTPEERVGQASALLERDAADLTPHEWTRLSALLDHPATRRSIGLPDELTGTKPLRQIATEIAAGKYRPTAKTERYFELYRQGRLSNDERLAQAATLLERDAADLTPHEWTRLSALLEHPATRRSIGLPDELPGTKPLRQIATEIAAGEYHPTAKTQRYFELYRQGRLSNDERLAQAGTLLERDAADLTPHEWTRLSALLDHPATRRSIGLPDELPGTKPLRQIATEIAAGKYRPTAKTERYFELYRHGRLSDDERLAQAGTLLEREAADLTSREWTRLSALLEHPATRRSIGLPDELPGTKPLRQIATEIAAGEYRPTPKTQRYFELYRLGRLSDDERLAQAIALLDREAADLTSAEWARLGAMLDHPSARGAIGLPYELAGVKPLRQIAGEISEGRYRPTARTQRYFEAFRIQRMDKGEQRDELARLFSKGAYELSSGEWVRLSAFLELPTTRKLAGGVPSELPGTKPLAQIASDVAAGKYRPTEKTQAYFTAWRRRNDPAYQQRLEAALSEVVNGSPSDQARRMVAGEWDRLATIVQGRPPAEQAAIAAVMMELDSVAGSRSVKSTLELLRANLRNEADLPAELSSVRDQTLELLDRNIGRLNGSTPTGAIRGYSNHPDYGEVGRIRANVALLRDVQAQRASNSARPGGDSRGNPAAATEGDELLAW